MAEIMPPESGPRLGEGQAQSAELQGPPQEWTCSHCTLHNDMGSRRCEACHSFRSSRLAGRGERPRRLATHIERENLHDILSGEQRAAREVREARGMSPARAIVSSASSRSQNGWRGGPLSEHDDAAVGASSRVVLICLCALMGALIGMIIQLICDDSDDTDVGWLLGLLVGGAIGICYGEQVNRRRQEHMLQDMARPWLDIEEGLREGDLRFARQLAAQGRELQMDLPPSRRILQHRPRGRIIEALAARRLHQQLLEQMGEQMEGEARAIPAEEGLIQALPTHQISREEISSVPEEHKSCTICMEDFKFCEEQRTLPCFHRFHKPCIDKWLRQSGICPICKTRVDSMSS